MSLHQQDDSTEIPDIEGTVSIAPPKRRPRFSTSPHPKPHPMIHRSQTSPTITSDASSHDAYATITRSRSRAFTATHGVPEPMTSSEVPIAPPMEPPSMISVHSNPLKTVPPFTFEPSIPTQRQKAFILDAIRERSDMISDQNASKRKDALIPREHDDSQHRDGALYEKHTAIVRAWNVLTEELRSIYTDPIGIAGGDDDEKESADSAQQNVDSLSADELLSEFLKSRELIEQQQRRLDQIDDTDHLEELIVHQSTLSVECIHCSSTKLN